MIKELWSKFHNTMAWLSKLNLSPEQELELAEMEDRFCNQIRMMKSAHKESVRTNIGSLKQEVQESNPTWVKEQRLSFLRDQLTAARIELARQKIEAAKIILNAEIERRKDLAYFMRTDDQEKRIKKIEKEIFYRESIKNQDTQDQSANEFEIQRAREVPLWKVLGVEPKSRIACPFHPDSSPSLYLYTDGRGHCFSCGKNVDAIGWLMEIDGYKFRDAVRRLNA